MESSNTAESPYRSRFPEILGQLESLKTFLERWDFENEAGAINESVKAVTLKAQILGIFRYSVKVSELDSVVDVSKINFSDAEKHLRVIDVYDLVLSDGAKTIKCLLSPTDNNNDKIRKGVVRVLDIVEISKLKLVQFSTCSKSDQIDTPPILLVGEINWLKVCPKIVSNIKDIHDSNGGGKENVLFKWDKTLLSNGETCPKFRPLLFRSRLAYFGMSNDDCLDCTASMLMPGSRNLAQAAQVLCHRAIVVEKDIEIAITKIKKGYVRRDPFWDQHAEVTCEFESLSKTHDSLMQAMDKAENETNKRLRNGINSLLIGKVVNKGPATHFAKSSTGSKMTLPFKFEFEIEDNTRKVHVTCWNSLCRKFYNSVHVGSYVAILNWRYRPKRVRKDSDEGGAQVVYDAEISMNPAVRYESSLWQIEEHQLHHFDNWKTRFPSVKVLGSLTLINTGSLLDITEENSPGNADYVALGIVIYLGRRQRVRGGDGKFYEYRWIMLMDDSSESCGKKLLIQVFANSQFVEFSQIKLGEAFFATHLKLCVEKTHTNKLSACLRSTGYSQFHSSYERIQIAAEEHLERSGFPGLRERFRNQARESKVEIIVDEEGGHQSMELNLFQNKPLQSTLLRSSVMKIMRSRFSKMELVDNMSRLMCIREELELGQCVSIRVKAFYENIEINLEENDSSFLADLFLTFPKNDDENNDINESNISFRASVSRDPVFDECPSPNKLYSIQGCVDLLKVLFGVEESDDELEGHEEANKRRKIENFEEQDTKEQNLLLRLEKSLNHFKRVEHEYMITLFRQDASTVEARVRSVFKNFTIK